MAGRKQMQGRTTLEKDEDARLLRDQRRQEKDAAQKRELRRVAKALERELSEANARAEFFEALDQAPDPEPYQISKLRGQGRRAPAASYVMMASDWHMGERVRPETVGYRNEYNPDIACERAEQFWKSNLVMLNAARSAWDIRQGVLWLGGDLMTGFIHGEYVEDNFLSPVEEALLVMETMVQGIDKLLAESDLEHILIPTSNGNHGRTGEKIKIGTYAQNSFEWMLYHMIRRRYCVPPGTPDTGQVVSSDGRLTFQIAKGYNNIVDLYGFRINFEHGDAIKYSGGVGGLTVPVLRRIGRKAMAMPLRWEGTEKGVPHLYAFGHYHSLQYPRFFIVNGCFEAGTRVLVPGGVKPIEQIKTGELVIARDGVSHEVVNTTTRQATEGTIELGIKGLPEKICCTPNHRIWAIKGETTKQHGRQPRNWPTVRNERPRWIEADYVSEGDWVHSPELRGQKTGDIDLLWTIGLYLAEGCAIVNGGSEGRANRIEFTMHFDELPVLERAKGILDKYLGEKFQGRAGRLSQRKERTTSTLIYNGRAVAQDYREQFGHLARGKCVPPWMFELNASSRRAIVEGWIDGDGHRGRQLSAVTVSEQLGWAMQTLAIGTGIEPMLYHQVRRPGGPTGRADAWRVSFVGGQDVLWIEGQRFLRVQSRQRKLETVSVYDLQVETDASYVAGGVGVHNSLIGWNAFAEWISCPYDDPQQCSFVVDERYQQVNNFNPIVVSKRLAK